MIKISKKTFVCSICEETIRNQWWGDGWWGNNASPINDGRCCNDCNQYVIMARIQMLPKEQAA